MAVNRHVRRPRFRRVRTDQCIGLPGLFRIGNIGIGNISRSHTPYIEPATDLGPSAIRRRDAAIRGHALARLNVTDPSPAAVAGLDAIVGGAFLAACKEYRYQKKTRYHTARRDSS
jgi:hypothetical protein